MADRLLVTCEHGGNDVPEAFRELLAENDALLATHRGYDPGALAMAEAIAAAFDAPLVAATTTRLLVDLNRSLGNPRLFSEASRRAPPEQRQAILEAHYLPYRQAVEQHVARFTGAGHRVLHVSSHSFTPVWHGEERHADIGLLYDPARHGELALCRAWETAYRRRRSALVVRRNYPYSGRADGLTTALRRQHPAEDYVGVELEVSQRFVLDSPEAWNRVRDATLSSLDDAMAALAEVPSGGEPAAWRGGAPASARHRP